MRLGVSPAAAPTPTGFFNQRFEALFPRAGTLGCVVCFAPRPLSGLSVSECGAAGSASGWTACPVRPTLRQSWSHHSKASPLLPGAVSAPPTVLDECLFFIFGVGLPFCSILSVLVVRGGTVCLPTPPSWFPTSFFKDFFKLHLLG